MSFSDLFDMNSNKETRSLPNIVRLALADGFYLKSFRPVAVGFEISALECREILPGIQLSILTSYLNTQNWTFTKSQAQWFQH
jgi:hypothetical protein